MTHTEISPFTRTAITVSIMLATVMNSLDTTIANVALPHMQGSLQASQEQISWVLTSYILASAIMTPMTAWLAARFGRKRLFLISIALFTAASVLCGVANSLWEIVLFRVLQGVGGAALIPLSQAELLDINPPEKHGQAMAIWGAGAVVGPILGPVLGGYITDHLTWRWVFLINLPVGICAFLGVLFYIKQEKEGVARPFDFIGFGALTLALGGLQLMLDRGPTRDWFSALEIWIYLVIAVLGIYWFVVHTITTDHPFFDPRLFADGNFVVSSTVGFFMGTMLFGSLALLPTMLQSLMGYPVTTTGVDLDAAGAWRVCVDVPGRPVDQPLQRALPGARRVDPERVGPVHADADQSADGFVHHHMVWRADGARHRAHLHSAFGACICNLAAGFAYGRGVAVHADPQPRRRGRHFTAAGVPSRQYGNLALGSGSKHQAG
ncbi:MAG: DHA2 family efflux MFS transporter permease subunit [Alphaproteobacteria bacterium]